jgi:hypothetical protein
MSASIPSVVQLQRAIKIAEKIQQLEAELASILGESHAVAKSVVAEAPRASAGRSKGRRPYTFSAATLAKRAAAQEKTQDAPVAAKKPRKKFKMSPEGRAAIVAAQKARWAKQKAQA